MIKHSCAALCSLFLFGLTSTSTAQVPDLMNYQGRLLDGTNLYNGNAEMVLRLYNAAVAGTLEYEDSNTVTVVDGLYSTFIGDDTLSGSLDNALTNEEVYLEVEVDGTILAPRERLSSVAYSLKADGVSTGSITTAMLADDAVTTDKIFKESVTGTEIANGSVSNVDLAADAVDSSKVADGSISNADIVANTFWETDGNAGIVWGTHFLGTTDDEPVEIRVNDLGVMRYEYAELPGLPAPNIIGGHPSNMIATAAVASVIGGGGIAPQPNIIYDDGIFIGGGIGNIAGRENGSDEDLSVIGGGEDNMALDDYISIGGGRRNEAYRRYVTIAGGRDNVAGEDFSTIGGGDSNVSTSEYSTISGGRANVVTGVLATISGGSFNEANGRGVAIGGGSNNVAHGVDVAIAGGTGNRADQNFAVIGGGFQNMSTSSWTSIGGGHKNLAGGVGSTIAGGGGLDLISLTFVSNTTLADFSVIAGGGDNVVSGRYGSVLGGKFNHAGGAASVALGGFSNRASGHFSLAAGRQARARHDGTFVWADSTDDDFQSSQSNAFLIRATEGVGIGTPGPDAHLHVVGNSDTGTLLVAPDLSISGGDSELVLSEDENASFAMKWLYDGGLNHLFLYGKDGSTINGPHMAIARDETLVGIGNAAPASVLDVAGGDHMTLVMRVTGDLSTTNEKGAGIELTGGEGGVAGAGASGEGGDIIIEAGEGGAGGAADGGMGGKVQILGGQAGTGGLSGPGGDVEIFGGDGTSFGRGGDVYVAGGNGFADGRVALAVLTNGMRFGEVGIGTNRPQALLDVAGTARVQVVEITGGSDLAEPFEVNAEEPVQPGMVVCIDPDRPGQLRLSSQAYDRTVAGVVSGANQLAPGLLLRQAGGIADGSHPVALSGRVYCWVDATNDAVRPGDLLTTSPTPGHAMRVADHTRAQGSIIGKAMTSLQGGRGLVLVLVSLQ